MARPKKCRRIGFTPGNDAFVPTEPTDAVVELLEEELEAIRLADLLEFDQSQASAVMDVSRGTFQRILTVARMKVADALVNGKQIRLLHGPQCETGRRQGHRGCGRCHRNQQNNSTL